MEPESGLRERKKNAMWGLIKKTALEMFAERGYENVSVAEIAAVAEVSKATVFNYFPSKEDLVVGGMKHHIGDPARVVRERARGKTPLAALRDRYLELLEHRAPQTGLSDKPLFLQVQRLIQATPSLLVSAMNYRRQSSVLLAGQLIDEGGEMLTSRLVASQVLHTQYILVEVNVRQMLDGVPVYEAYSKAVSAAEHAFGLLEHGIGDLMRRETDPPEADAAYMRDGCRADYEPGRAEAEEAGERVLEARRTELLEALADHSPLHREGPVSGRPLRLRRMMTRLRLMSSLDHLVLATPDLAATVEEVGRLTGTKPVPGGAHPGLGTRNFLLGLGEGAYLEIIGPDPDQDAPERSRPFGIDVLHEARLVTWAVQVEGIDEAVAASREAGYDPGAPWETSRQTPDGDTLTWKLTLDRAGRHRGPVPFLIDWGTTPHPAADLPVVPLVGLEAVHPHPERVEPHIEAVGAKLPLKAGNRGSLAATVFGETGLVVFV